MRSSQTQNLDLDTYGKRLAAAALEYRRAQTLVDEVKREVFAKQRFADQAASVAAAAYTKLHALIMEDAE